MSLLVISVILINQCGTSPVKDTASDIPYRSLQSYVYRGDRIDIRDWSVDGSQSIGKCRIEVTPRAGSPSTIEFDIDGRVLNSPLTDLDRDGHFEVIAITQSAGSGSYGNALVYEYIDGAWIERTLPPLNETLRVGYMGHDQFEVTNDRLIRAFPVYRLNDSNSGPTGGTRMIFYQINDKRWLYTSSHIGRMSN